jgi:peptide/nickel transport system permease protein
MLRYVLRRIAISIPTLLLISLAVFGLSHSAPGDPVVSAFGEEALQYSFDVNQNADNYRRKAALLGIDKPLFYAALTTAVYPDTTWGVYPLDRRNRLVAMAAQNGDWGATCAFEKAVFQALQTVDILPDTLQEKPVLRLVLLDLSTQNRLDRLEEVFHKTDSMCRPIENTSPAFRAVMDTLRDKTAAVCQTSNPLKKWTPAVCWYGTNNQYHHWLVGFLTGNWGLTKKQLPVWQELKPALFATLSINGISLFFAYLISIPLGVEMARRKGRCFDRWIQRVLVFLHAMPVFWVGSLLVLLFCSPLVGKPIIPNPYLDISDAWNMSRESFPAWFSGKLPKFLLPILVMTLYSLSIITLQMRGGMLETLGADYIRTARAKGVPEDDVYWIHAFRNAMFPAITLFSSVFSAMLTGSLVIETLFNFPGMGLKAQTAFMGHDLAVLSAILMAGAVFTMLGNLLADLMYVWADPRVRFVSEK